ncbi:MAG: hypothetical protein JWM27_2888 [Gemmatimonadetes bacterium]|nr:hypothetical protein [Gemmatimonadota bacterium]
MAAHSSGVPENVPFRTLPRGGPTTIVAAVLVVLGVATFFLVPRGGEDPGRIWRAFQFNWLFWASTAMGMVMLAVALHLTNARWAWSIRRFALAGVAFLPVAWLLFIPMFWGGKDFYFHHWIGVHGDPVIDAKAAWLNVDGMFIRDMVALTLLFGLAFRFAWLALRVDVFGARGDAGQQGWYDRLTGGFRGVPEEAARSVSGMNRTGVFLSLGYAILWSIIGIDLAMTMMPHWFSTMFPVAFFIAGFHAGMAATAILVVLFRKRIGIERFITPTQFHDLGKLIFAFSVFWMYLNWSQYVVIWYGLLPHEQEWFVRRFNPPFTTMAQLVPLLIFVFPFLALLAAWVKKIPAYLALVAGVILVGNWIERFMITTPSVYEGSTLPFGLPEVGIALGFMGLFLACYVWFLRTFPMLPSPAFMAAQDPATIEVPVGAAVTH